MDVFIEKIVARKKTGQDRLMVAGIIVAAFVALIVVSSIPIINSLGPVLWIVIGFLAFQFAKSRNIEFEYAVTNGDLDIDKIIAQRKRKRVFSGSAKDFEIVAKVKSDKYTNEYKNIAKKIEAVSSMESPDIYFVVAPYKGERTIVYFEPDKRMLDNFKIFIPRKVSEW